MRMRVSPVAVLLPGLLLGACSTTPEHMALPAGAQDKIASTDVVLPIRQSEIYVYVPPSTGGAQAGAQYGLVGALVGAAIDGAVNDHNTSAAETAVKPLRDALLDNNFDSTLQSEIKQSLGQIAWVHGDDYRVVRDITPAGLDGVLSGSKDSAVLFVTAEYRLSNNGRILEVFAWARLFPNDDALKTMVKGSGSSRDKTDIENTIYRDAFYYDAKLADPGSDRDKNIAAWSANNGAETRLALARGAKEIANMLAADLQGGDQPSATAEEIGKSLDPSGLPAEDSQGGKIVSSDDDGQLVRLNDGTLKYVATASSLKAALASESTSAPAAASAPPAAPAASAPSASTSSAQPAS